MSKKSGLSGITDIDAMIASFLSRGDQPALAQTSQALSRAEQKNLASSISKLEQMGEDVAGVVASYSDLKELCKLIGVSKSFKNKPMLHAALIESALSNYQMVQQLMMYADYNHLPKHLLVDVIKESDNDDSYQRLPFMMSRQELRDIFSKYSPSELCGIASEVYRDNEDINEEMLEDNRITNVRFQNWLHDRDAGLEENPELHEE